MDMSSYEDNLAKECPALAAFERRRLAHINEAFLNTTATKSEPEKAEPTETPKSDHNRQALIKEISRLTKQAEDLVVKIRGKEADALQQAMLHADWMKNLLALVIGG